MFITPKGLRRHNPFNLMCTNPRQGWAGAVSDGAFDGDREEEFIADLWGLRAGMIVLLNDELRRGEWTIDQIFDGFAPAFENDTEAYKQNMADGLGVARTDRIDLRDRDRLVKLSRLITRQEEGQQPYDDALLYAAADAALKSVVPVRSTQ
jgi:hypothetical protein